MSRFEFTPEQERFLESRFWAALATGRRDGSPQLSQLVIYGTAECIDRDPERAELTARVFRRLTGKADMRVDDAFVTLLDEQQRTVLRIRPEKAFLQD